MNHNYYYILLGKRARGTAVQPPCSAGKLMRYLSAGPNAGGLPGVTYYTGYSGNQADAQYNLAFGGAVEVFSPAWPLTASGPYQLGSLIYLDEAMTQQLPAIPGTWFQVEGQVFSYNYYSGQVLDDPSFRFGVTDVLNLSQAFTQSSINVGSQYVCDLNAPYPTQIWADSDNWQTVQRVWTDAARTQPFQGGGLWYGVDPNGNINGMGTTIQINNCGQVVGLYAC